ncbi:hypothetical protein QBE53_06400 [Vallitaleaceae bacterium 9-2]
MIKKIKSLIIFSVFLSIAFPLVVSANSAEPPGIVVILEGGQRATDAWMMYDDKKIPGRRIDYPFEAQFWFKAYFSEEKPETFTLNVVSENGQIYNYNLDIKGHYHNTYTVNMKNMEITSGKSLSRSILLIFSRVILTLLLEGFIFYLFSFRQKKSWAIFVVVNLMTQIGLNIYINSVDVAASYPIIIYFFGEFWVFFAEIIAVSVLVKEKKVSRRIAYTFIANVVSLIAGGYILTWLPL